MRVIGTLPHENQARKFSLFLEQQGIANSCDMTFDSITGHMSYQIWIHDEDRLEEAAQLLAEFEKDPSRFETVQTPIVEEEEDFVSAPPPLRYKTYLTTFVIALCTLLFFLDVSEHEEPVEQLTPIESALMYDLPPDFEQKPYWQGIYTLVVAKIKKEDPTPYLGPLFIKIREGEVWRLISPIFLHGSLLHLLFNMLWVWYLARPIEQRIGAKKLSLLILTAAIIPNTLQYLLSGPFFVGYSAVVTAMAGFIWMREKLAPWEGYQITKSTFSFLILFVAAIFLLQVVAFFIQVLTSSNFAPNIANAAHIIGAVVGVILARSKYFAQKVST